MNSRVENAAMAMDDLRVGALARAVRHRVGWTQQEVADRVGVSQKVVSLFERGHMDRLTVRSARRVANALEIQLPFAPRWRGGDGVRLLDSDHAALVNQVVALLRAAGWDVVVEYTFNHYGERGSVDVVAWHPGRRCLLITEVKGRLLDTQDTVAALGRKARIVPGLLEREHGWRPAAVGVVLVLSELTANRSAVARHAATFAVAYPHRGRDVRRWLREPTDGLLGLWFLSPSSHMTGTRPIGGRKRVRRPTPRMAAEPPVAL